jgi:uncharacterized protein YfaQ (DUF2300 family)
MTLGRETLVNGGFAGWVSEARPIYAGGGTRGIDAGAVADIR